MYFLLKMVTFHCYVSLPEGILCLSLLFRYHARIFTKSVASTLYNSNALLWKVPANLILLPSPILIVISDDGYDMAPYYKGWPVKQKTTNIRDVAPRNPKPAWRFFRSIGHWWPGRGLDWRFWELCSFLAARKTEETKTRLQAGQIIATSADQMVV